MAIHPIPIPRFLILCGLCLVSTLAFFGCGRNTSSESESKFVFVTVTPTPPSTHMLVSVNKSISTATSVPANPTPTATLLNTPTAKPIIKPSEIKTELSLMPGPTSVSPPPWCGNNVNYSIPTLVTETVSSQKEIQLGEKVPEFCVCGYHKGESLIVSLINPLGEIIIKDAVTLYESGWNDVPPQCFHIRQSSLGNFGFLPSNPLGRYTVNIWDPSEVLVTYTFDLIDAGKPIVYKEKEYFAIAGFKPNEEVQILEYIINWDNDTAELTQNYTVKLNQEGQYLWPNHYPDAYVAVFVIRDDFSIIQTLDPSIASPVN